MSKNAIRSENNNVAVRQANVKDFMEAAKLAKLIFMTGEEIFKYAFYSEVENIWDSIAVSNSAIPMHEWQKKELDRRYKEYKEEKLQLHDWKAVHEDLREKYK